MKQEKRLYNMLLPIWLIWIFPSVWLILLPGNLAIDAIVLWLALTALKHRDRGSILKQVWWKIWLLGFAADAVGVLWMTVSLAGQWFSLPVPEWWRTNLAHTIHNPFSTPAAFLWTLAGVVLSGVCIYCFDRRALRSCGSLSTHEQRRAAAALAVFTAPWLFFLPAY